MMIHTSPMSSPLVALACGPPCGVMPLLLVGDLEGGADSGERKARVLAEYVCVLAAGALRRHAAAAGGRPGGRGISLCVLTSYGQSAVFLVWALRSGAAGL